LLFIILEITVVLTDSKGDDFGFQYHKCV